MQKTAILTAIALTLSACTSYPAAINYRPKGSESAPYVITSQLNQWTNNLKVFIDGQKVTDGTLSFADLSGQFFGTYDGHKVNVSCSPAAGQPECQVLVDGELAGKI